MALKKTTNKTLGRKKTRVCPQCGSAEIIPIVHGIATPTLQKLIDEGNAIIADRESGRYVGNHAIGIGLFEPGVDRIKAKEIQSREVELLRVTIDDELIGDRTFVVFVKLVWLKLPPVFVLDEGRAGVGSRCFVPQGRNEVRCIVAILCRVEFAVALERIDRLPPIVIGRRYLFPYLIGHPARSSDVRSCRAN